MEPESPIPYPPHRQIRLLRYLLFSLISITLLVLFAIIFFGKPPIKFFYIGFITFILILLVMALYQNNQGRYFGAARILVAAAMLGPWGSMVLDPRILQGDFIPLLYIVISIFICSLLLSMLETILIAAVQFIVLCVVLFSSPAIKSFNWSSFLFFILFVSVISILTNYIRKQDLNQLTYQTIQLQKSQVALVRESHRDSLTGLYNRRYMDKILDILLEADIKNEIPLSLMMMDIDRFKEVNDTYGHEAGDMVLQSIGTALSKNIRETDCICRYGGDEIIIIMQKTPPEISVDRAEKIRQQVETIEIEAEEGVISGVTISVGVASFPESGETKRDILRAADKALYRAKESGRNCVIAFSQLEQTN